MEAVSIILMSISSLCTNKTGNDKNFHIAIPVRSVVKSLA